MKKITYNLNKIIIGQILADGHVEITGKNCRLSFSFGTAYQEYANWIYFLIKDYCSNSVYTVLSKAKDKSYINYRLKTRTNLIFNQYHEIFYKILETGKYRKIVPINIEELICPIVLAHLIIGDGTFSPVDSRIRISTYNYTFQECEMLSKAIKNNCNIVSKVLYDRIGHSGEKQYILTIGKNQLIKVQQTVQIDMHQTILYRIGIISPS